MKNGYKIFWTDNAKNELKQTLRYLEKNWSEKETIRLVQKLDKTLLLISINPFLFPPSSSKKEIRKAVILTFNSLYYLVRNQDVFILSFFSNRQNPKKLGPILD